ncbi:fimbrial protein [Ewingella americana]|uniref:fimbrial protein n=1 Tax=Ewingella americana TaxID=41202 RepID=UPI00163A06B3|nr:fimbrial protein [Ewingella americana]QMV52645.1 type 1 fimbrial protein [Ewingella americana]
MNKKIIAIAILAGSAFASVAHAASGTINFTGNVTAATCTIDTAGKSQTVALGTVGTTDFPTAGSTSGNGKISMVLSACPAGATQASVSFGGPADANNGNLLKLSSAATATGVAIALFEDDGVTAIPLGNPSATHTLTPAADTTLTYFAKYQSTAATVGEGTADAAADFTILYN